MSKNVDWDNEPEEDSFIYEEDMFYKDLLELFKAYQDKNGGIKPKTITPLYEGNKLVDFEIDWEG